MLKINGLEKNSDVANIHSTRLNFSTLCAHIGQSCRTPHRRLWGAQGVTSTKPSETHRLLLGPHHTGRGRVLSLVRLRARPTFWPVCVRQGCVGGTHYCHDISNVVLLTKLQENQLFVGFPVRISIKVIPQSVRDLMLHVMS